MRLTSSDRRCENNNVAFPLIDSEGNRVTFDRRSGKDRRLENRDTVAREIMSMLN